MIDTAAFDSPTVPSLRPPLRRFALRSIVCAAALSALALAFLVPAAFATGEIDVIYTGPSSFTVSVVGTGTIGSGAVIAPGEYTLQLEDDNEDMNPNFTFTGPGVSLSTNLDTTGMGIDSSYPYGPYVLAASSSYTMADTNGAGSITFSTSAGGSPSQSSGASGSGGGTLTTSGGSSSSGSSGSSASGATSLGTITAAISASGKLSLELDGGAKPLVNIKAGAYKLSLVDMSSAKLEVSGPDHASYSITKSKPKGLYTLGKGIWTFESSMSAKTEQKVTVA